MNNNQDYTRLGGLLLVWYWTLVVGAVLTLIALVIPALLTIVASLFTGIVYAIGMVISIGSLCVSAVYELKAASQLKSGNPQFFDSFLFGMLIVFAGTVLSGILTIRSASGVSRFVSSTIGNTIRFALSLCIAIMYFSKSKRVYAYFGGRPLHQSQYWNWISILPEFIISDNIPDPSQLR